MDIARKDRIKENIAAKLMQQFGKTTEDASREQLFEAVALSLRDDIMTRWRETDTRNAENSARKLYYLSVEFLLGRSLSSNMMNLFEEEEYKAALEELSCPLSALLPE